MLNAQSQGYFAIDDIDIRDGYCGVTPQNAGSNILTTPQTGTRPTTPFQSIFHFTNGLRYD